MTNDLLHDPPKVHDDCIRVSSRRQSGLFSVRPKDPRHTDGRSLRPDRGSHSTAAEPPPEPVYRLEAEDEPGRRRGLRWSSNWHRDLPECPPGSLVWRPPGP